jgi:hypothetical protein
MPVAVIRYPLIVNGRVALSCIVYGSVTDNNYRTTIKG